MGVATGRGLAVGSGVRASIPIALATWLSSLAAGLAAAGTGRWFPDRPVAWDEHDRRDLPAPPEANHLQDLETTLTIRDGVANEIDRVLALEGRRPALDV